MISFNEKRCVGCYACQVVCKMEKGFPVGVFGITVLKGEEADENGVFRPVFRTSLCRHCTEAQCVRICPVRAITRDQHGMVVGTPEKCIGCRLCLLACPRSVPDFTGAQRVSKCNGCVERLQVGLQPRCVASCPTAALESVTRQELSEKKRRGYLEKRWERRQGTGIPSR